MSKTISYPLVGNRITKSMDVYQKMYGKTSLQSFVDEIKERTSFTISKSTLYFWQTGQRAPKNNAIFALAKFFYPHDKEAQDSFIVDLKSARAEDLEVSPAVGGGIIKRFDDETSLKVSSFNIPPLTIGDQNYFIDYLFKGLCNSTKMLIDTEIVNIDDRNIDQIIEKEEFEIVLGVSQSVFMGSLFKMLSLPISLPVNAVYVNNHLLSIEKRESSPELKSEFEYRVKELREAFIGFDNPKSQDIINPITAKHSIGEQYVKQNLGISFSPLNSHGLNSYYLKLLSFPSEAEQELIPLAVIDELSCIELIKMLDRVNIEAKLLFPIGLEEREFLQEYKVGIGISRNDVKLQEYFTEIFELYLESNSQKIAYLYARTYKNQYNSIAQLEPRLKSAIMQSSKINITSLKKQWLDNIFFKSNSKDNTLDFKELPKYWKNILHLSKKYLENK